MSEQILVLYVPVLHQGYVNFFRKWRCIRVIYLLGQDLLEELVYLEKEIRALNPQLMASLIHTAGFFMEVRVLRKETLHQLTGKSIITADEGVSRRLIGRYFPGNKVVYDSVFLRWDETYVDTQKPVESFTVSCDPFDKQMIELARREGSKSSDWWRRVGSVLVRDGKIVLASHNQHLPSEHTPYVLGDIRDFIPSGTKSDVSSAIHSEKAVIALAARQGISLAGADLYVSIFPCPDCAKMIAFSGVKRLFFGGGHVTFHGEEVLHSFGVELIYVK